MQSESTTKIEGNLNAVIDSDSSDSSDSEDEHPAVFSNQAPLVKPSIPLQDDDDENDEEELEVFDSSGQQTARRVTSTKIKQAKVKPFVEKDFNKEKTNQNDSETTETSTSTKKKSEVDDGFGIKYQPIKIIPRTEKEEILTKSELDMLRKIAQPSDDDDEFDVVGDEDQVPSNNQAILKALEGFGTADPMITNNFDHREHITPEISTYKEASTVKSGKSSILADAQKALSEVRDIYSSGLGDQEVLLLNSNTKNEPNSNTSGGVYSKNAPVGIIDEGDEETEERLEEEAGKQEMQQMLDAAQLQLELEQEWEAVSQVLVDALKKDLSPEAIENIELPKSITCYDHALKYFQCLNLSRFRKLISTTAAGEETSSGKSSWFGSKTKVVDFPGRQRILEFPFLIAQVAYDPKVEQHLSMLNLTYDHFLVKRKKLAGMNPLRKHWQLLGFQGNDPCTDLNRSMKMLSILQLLDLLQVDPEFSHILFDNSQSAVPESEWKEKRGKGTLDTSWPFMLVSIQFTKESIQALRSGALEELFSKEKDAISLINDFHHAVFMEFYGLLTSQAQTHHAIHLTTIRKQCEKSPLKLLTKYRKTKKILATVEKLPLPAPTTTKQTDKKQAADPVGFAPPIPSADGPNIRFDSIATMEEIAVEEVNENGKAKLVFTTALLALN